MLDLCRVRLGIDVGSRFISIDRVVKEMDNNKEQGGETVTSLLTYLYVEPIYSVYLLALILLMRLS